MEPFKVYILGCGSALPTLRHSLSSQVVELRGKQFMVDCGEGTQMQLRRSRIRFTKLGHVFLTHLHGDHCFGLIGMISTFGLLGRTAPLHVYADAALGPMLDAQVKLFCSGLGYEVVFHPVDTKVAKVIYEDRSLTVETVPLRHRVPCCGYIFREKPTLPHIRREMLGVYDIPVSQINNIKAGADWTLDDGTVIPNAKLVSEADPVRSYAYCSDTAYLPQLHKQLQGVTTLYHEATYGRDNEASAAKYCHSTAAQAATVARDAGVGRLIIGHYSARYDDENVLLNEAREIFPNTVLADENKVFNV